MELQSMRWTGGFHQRSLARMPWFVQSRFFVCDFVSRTFFKNTKKKAVKKFASYDNFSSETSEKEPTGTLYFDRGNFFFRPRDSTTMIHNIVYFALSLEIFFDLPEIFFSSFFPALCYWSMCAQRIYSKQLSKLADWRNRKTTFLLGVAFFCFWKNLIIHRRNYQQTLRLWKTHKKKFWFASSNFKQFFNFHNLIDWKIINLSNKASFESWQIEHFDNLLPNSNVCLWRRWQSVRSLSLLCET